MLQLLLIMLQREINTNKYAWEKGLWTGRPPIGYKKLFFGNGKFTYVLDETKFCYVKKIFELYATGLHSLKSLKKKCRECNLTSNKSVKNQPIDKNTIDRILRNTFYTNNFSLINFN